MSTPMIVNALYQVAPLLQLPISAVRVTPAASQLHSDRVHNAAFAVKIESQLIGRVKYNKVKHARSAMGGK